MAASIRHITVWLGLAALMACGPPSPWVADEFRPQTYIGPFGDSEEIRIGASSGVALAAAMADATIYGNRGEVLFGLLYDLPSLMIQVECTKVMSKGPGVLVVAAVVATFESETDASVFEGAMEANGWACWRPDE